MKESKKNHVLKDLLKKHNKYFFPVILFSFFTAYLPVTPIVYMRSVFGPVVNSDSLQYLFWLTMLLIGALILNGVIDWVRDRVMTAGTVSFCSKVEKQIYENTFQQNEGKWSDGTKAMSDLRTIRQFMTSPISGALFDAPFSALLLLTLFFIHPLMGFFSLFGALMAFLIGLLIEKKVAPYQENAIDSQLKSRSALNGCFQNIAMTASRNNIYRIFDKWSGLHKTFLLHQGNAQGYQAIGTSCCQSVLMIQGSMLLGLGMGLTLIGLIDFRMAGNLIIAKFIGALAIRPAMMIVMSWTQVIAFRSSVKGIATFLEDYSLSTNEKTALPKPNGHLKAINAEYQDIRTKKKLLQRINFQVPAGNVVAVMGRSGSGKTTLLKLMAGLLAPSSGSMRLDGVAVASWDKKELSPWLGYLPQEQELFAGLASENISRFQETEFDSLKKACEDANLIEYWEGYQSGIDLNLDSDMNTISGGIRQKIALARAFYKSPKVLLLDEPTSHLDDQSRLKILDSIKRYRDKNSLVVIATHDKDLLLLADFILVLKNGIQVSFDSKQELMKRLAKKN